MTDVAAGPVLETARLRLVPCGPEHVDRLHAILVSEDVRRYLLDGDVVSRDWVAGVVEASRTTFAESRYGLWCLCGRSDGTIVGMAGLRVSRGARQPQLLYALDRASWGRGLATEASQAVADYAFGELAYPELLASTDPPNQASVRVMERLGMRFLESGRMAGHALILYRLGRDDWTKRRAGAASAAPTTALDASRRPEVKQR